jgi:hypothetical protein
MQTKHQTMHLWFFVWFTVAVGTQLYSCTFIFVKYGVQHKQSFDI